MRWSLSAIHGSLSNPLCREGGCLCSAMEFSRVSFWGHSGTATKATPYTGCSCFSPTKFWLLWGLSHKHPGIPSQDLSPALPLEERNPHQRYHSPNYHSVPRTVPTLCLCISLSVCPRSDRWGHWVTKTFSPSLWFTRAGTQCCGSKRPPFPRYQAASTFFFSLLLTKIQLTIPSLSFRN